MSINMHIYNELQSAFDHFNQVLFNNECPPCLITLQRQSNTMGYMSYNRFSKVDNSEYLHELALNPEYFGVKPIIEIFQTMVHEICHLIIYIRGQDTRKTYHNSHWADLMESVGLIPSHTGRIGGKRVGQKMADYPEPNGLFVVACNDLLSKGNIIEWYDRFLPKKTTTAQIYNDLNFAQSQLSGTSLSPLLEIPVVKNDTIKSLKIKEIMSVSGDLIIANNDSETPSSPLESNIEPSIKVKKNGNKIKYTCQCGTNVWGKSGINITCNICQKTFIEQ